MNFVLDGVDQSLYVIAVFMDIQKAFDCISHDILIEKLKYY